MLYNAFFYDLVQKIDDLLNSLTHYRCIFVPDFTFCLQIVLNFLRYRIEVVRLQYDLNHIYHSLNGTECSNSL